MGCLLAGVTFVVVVCGNSNEKRKKKNKTKQNKTKPEKLFFLQKGGINIIFLYGTTKALSTRIRFNFFFSRFSLPPTTYPGKTVTKNASFKNALQRGDFRKSRLVLYVLKGENGGFPIR